MMSIMFVIGQLSAPIEQLIQFVRSAQDAAISIGRINEIRMMKDEYETKEAFLDDHQKDIRISNLSFSYNYPEDKMVIHNLNLIFPRRKVTAIVGASGSGKTTLMKLLLGFYTPTYGKIIIGNNDINTINPFQWRSEIGAVLQDGFIFSSTIAENIALSDLGEIDLEQVVYAAKIACIHDYIITLTPWILSLTKGQNNTNASQIYFYIESKKDSLEFFSVEDVIISKYIPSDQFSSIFILSPPNTKETPKNINIVLVKNNKTFIANKIYSEDIAIRCEFIYNKKEGSPFTRDNSIILKNNEHAISLQVSNVKSISDTESIITAYCDFKYSTNANFVYIPCRIPSAGR